MSTGSLSNPTPSVGRPALARFALFFTATASLLGAYHYLGPWRDVLISDRKLSLLEARWHKAADLVIAGDSRSQAAFVPEILAEQLGCRVLNFAQSSRRLHGRYFDAVERVLDEKGGRPTLILGVSAYSLSRNSQEYTDEADTLDPVDRWALLHMDRVTNAIRPLYKWDVVKLLHRDTLPRRVGYHHEDGWVTIERIPRDEAAELDIYRRYFDDEKVDASLVAGLLERVRQWHARGVRVIAVRSPSSDAMLELEDRMSGLDVASLAGELQAAGADWISVPRSSWPTEDGGHLTADAARAFTSEVASAVARLRPATPQVVPSGSLQ
jgi:hypothetical protein